MRKATIEVEWEGDGLASALIEAALDRLMIELLATDGVTDPAISATLENAQFDLEFHWDV